MTQGSYKQFCPVAMAAEILVVTPAIRALIRDDKYCKIQGLTELQ